MFDRIAGFLIGFQIHDAQDYLFRAMWCDTHTIDVVYVYCNKTSEIVFNEFHKAIEETSSFSTTKAGFQRSPPSKSDTEDMDTLSLSVKTVSAFAKNLGTIYILVTHPEEVNPDITNMPNVKVIPSSVLGMDLQFSAAKSESVMHRIPGISTLFVAMNDDMILTKPVDLRTFFFTPNGSPKVLVGTDPRVESPRHTLSRLRKTQSGGARPQIQYTISRLERLRSTGLIRGKYPSHAPRPYHRSFVDYIEQRDPKLFQTPFKTVFRCQECLNMHVLTILHSAEAGTLRRANGYTLLAYIDSKRIWEKVVRQWDSIRFLTLQEVEPDVQSIVSDFVLAKLQS